MPSPSHPTRRAALAAVGAGLSALAGCSSLPAPLQSRPDSIECDPLSATWPTAGANPGRTGVAPAASLPPDDAELRVVADEQDPTYGGHEAPPAVAGGTAYSTASGRTAARGTTDWTTDFLGGGRRRMPALSCGAIFTQAAAGVFAFDARDGTERWRAVDRYAKPGPGAASPAVAGGTLYVGTQEVVAYDPLTGERRWVGGYPESTEVTGLAATDGLVVAPAQFDHDGYGYVACFDEDGTRQWLLRPRPVDFDFATPVIADGSVYVATDSGVLLAIDIAGGTTRWQASIDHSVRTGLAVHDGTVFVPAGGGDTVRAIDAADGSTRWTKRVPNAYVAPAVVDGRLLVCTRRWSTGDGSETGAGFLALDPATGEVTHRWLVGAFGPFSVGDGGLYFAGGGHGTLLTVA